MADPSSPVWRDLSTESRHPASHDLDVLPSHEVVRLLLEEDRRGIECALAQGDVIARGADWIAEAIRDGHDVVLLGAGTSGRLGVVEAAECPPTFGTGPHRVRARIAGGRDAVFAAREGAEDRTEDGAAATRELHPGDLLIGISASSVTPFVRGGLDAARERGLRTILLTCASADAVRGAADLVLALATGPEILTGSTRLKAGSATKAALNALTTTAMVRLGKTFENLMVDLRPGSAKLVDRSRRIVAAATGLGIEEAEELLEHCGGEVKTAIVVSRTGLSITDARERLRDSAGHVRRAIDG